MVKDWKHAHLPFLYTLRLAQCLILDFRFQIGIFSEIWQAWRKRRGSRKERIYLLISAFQFLLRVEPSLSPFHLALL